jgi:hypothetical protein
MLEGLSIISYHVLRNAGGALYSLEIEEIGGYFMYTKVGCYPLFGNIQRTRVLMMLLKCGNILVVVCGT